jgi:hypothetical protein
MTDKLPIPPETCPDIDAILKEASALSREAMRLWRLGDDIDVSDAVSFIDEVDSFFRGFDDKMEALRHSNAALREAAIGYYQRLKETGETK